MLIYFNYFRMNATRKNRQIWKINIVPDVKENFPPSG